MTIMDLWDAIFYFSVAWCITSLAVCVVEDLTSNFVWQVVFRVINCVTIGTAMLFALALLEAAHDTTWHIFATTSIILLTGFCFVWVVRKLIKFCTKTQTESEDNKE